MGKFYDGIPDFLLPWLRAQPVFFVATAPLKGGTVNTSPKAREEDGKQLLQIVDSRRVCYMDLTGSGNETIAHLREPGNGRITLMWVNLVEGPPRIVRLFGKGTVHERMDPNSSFHELAPPADRVPIGVRAIIEINLFETSSAQTSCGYSIPIFQPLSRPRRTLAQYMEKEVLKPPKEEDKHVVSNGLGSYWIFKNTLSVDGMPGLQTFDAQIDASERERLANQRREHDEMQVPPLDPADKKAISAGWVAPPPAEEPPAPKGAAPQQALALAPASSIQVGALAFAAGCIATTLAMRLMTA